MAVQLNLSIVAFMPVVMTGKLVDNHKSYQRCWVKVNLEARERLADIVKTSRGSLSQRAYGKLLGVSATAVQDWEKGESVPETDNLARIAERAGYTLEQLLNYLDGKSLPETTDVERIVRQIQYLPLPQVAVIAHAVGDRLASVGER